MKAMSQPAPNPEVLDRAIRRAKWRLIPFMLLMYLLCYLDRANIGFAKQSFQAATSVSDAAFAFGAGAFFLTYALFEIPSNLILHRVGARRWMARIMVTWGLISSAMIFGKTTRPFQFCFCCLARRRRASFPARACS
jgi:sugar phosphate permease